MYIEQIISKFDIPIEEVVIASNLISRINDFALEYNALLVTDGNIYQTINGVSAEIDKLILENPKANQQHIEQITKAVKEDDYDLIIAIGSGTINDLCKLASFKLGIDYIIFASATSMNGYASANASITIDGHKKTIPAHLPKAIYFDLNILTKAPIRLIKAGIGDSICFSTCQFDWLLSHLLLKTEYVPEAFEILEPFQEKLLNGTDYNIRDSEFIEILCSIITLSGLSMYISGGSYPASQSEHLIAHYLDIKYPQISKQSFHGEQIAITTLTVAQMQQEILQKQTLKLSQAYPNIEKLEEILGLDIAKQCYLEIENKRLEEEELEELNQRLKDNWLEIKKQLKACFITKEKLLEISNKFKLPKDVQEIGFSKDIYKEALSNAHLIRDRFTCLDIVNQLK
ncbi:MAG: iron-containing alcohol dehydrogenase [Proteobacteria bacterium]|nr:iron-containing alcohol dehydrogenase [Pseudomonadota bacterium]